VIRFLLGGVIFALSAAASHFAYAEDLSKPVARKSVDYRLLQLDGHQVKWGASAIGTGASVRYMLVPTAMYFGETRNCRGLTPMDALLAASGIDPAKVPAEVAAAFDMWERAANISFQRVDHPAAADILIGAQAIPRGRAFTEVIYDRNPPMTLTGAGPANVQPAASVRRIDKALICLNPEKPWKIGFGGDVEIYDLRYTIAHEIGHAIGLDHPGPSGQMMGFGYEEHFRVLQPGDIAGAIALYGRRGAPVAKSPVPVARPADSHGMALQ
jgi:hypothetical protein